ncbi:hypothetical protein Hdeb2414_s0034g00726601 [Helianthus debilis subsp. tardiflorus]
MITAARFASKSKFSSWLVASMNWPQVTKYKILVSAQPHRKEGDYLRPVHQKG